MYLVRSEVMDEVDRMFGRDGRPYFDGTVGVLSTVEDASGDDEMRREVGVCAPGSESFQFLLVLGIGIGIPLAIIGSLTKFHPGDSSTHSQRVWLMTWLGFGLMGMAAVDSLQLPSGIKTSKIPLPKDFLDFLEIIIPRFKLAIMLGYCAPAIGGLVIVAQMMKEYGDCVRLY
ncbi:hypothetical protein B0H16DRAFT_1717546 [Mycena metata]|uniref:Uncharacterized protein n=1 Tax=Mycena metata TaxID=1033252 RepID=A0AAD7JIL3_9AGAR|nr:hypothetical protein B0H16DRAFT_1717546 [Mycena metata]